MLDSVELRQEIDHGLSIDGVPTSPTHEKGQEPPLKLFMRCAAISATAVLLLILSDKVQA